MRLSPRRLNRSLLARQSLLARDRSTVLDMVRRIVALQAQEPASPYLALWNRVEGFEPDALDRAFAERTVVKATLMRITLHAVAAEDYTSFHEAMRANLRASRLHDRRYTSTGLTVADADAVLPRLLAHTATPRAPGEIDAMLSEHLGAPSEPRLWWALKTFAPLTHVPTGGAWSFGRSGSFAAAPTHPPRPEPAVALQHLARRYLEGFGPASPEDFAQFALQHRSVARDTFAALAGSLVRFEREDGTTLYDVPTGTLAEEDVAAPPRLMAMWDSTLLAHADRTRVVPAEYKPLVIRRNGDVLPTLLVDGHVAGVWRTAAGGIEVTAFRRLGDEDWAALDAEARSLLAFLEPRDPGVYRRYAHWWKELPAAEVRVLGG